ncbi:MucBP domain-containing protein [Lactobacillus panisapium]|uniref:BspA family leucine-rich repeat surface protein n=1 Tax=Lactobacillus panisapium TaxID=2012495 RepID=A0ABX8W7T5_9LACO|nr:MucBP domain-containing protein [Lactobacillus panisapium]QYN53557.1 BspA family leucine-rich repeat surface protein [Lactobacillus panisapium]
MNNKDKVVDWKKAPSLGIILLSLALFCLFAAIPEKVDAAVNSPKVIVQKQSKDKVQKQKKAKLVPVTAGENTAVKDKSTTANEAKQPLSTDDSEIKPQDSAQPFATSFKWHGLSWQYDDNSKTATILGGEAKLVYDPNEYLSSLVSSNTKTIKIAAPLKVSGDTTNLFNFFTNATSIDLSNLDTSQLKSMASLFENCKSLTNITFGNIDTSNVSDMSSMFKNCRALTSLDLSHFNTAQVITMSSMFDSCSSLTSLDLSHFDTAQVRDMSMMFSQDNSLTQLDVSHFNTAQVMTMANMFGYCQKLKTINVNNFNTSNVQDFSGVFVSCYSLTDLDISNFDMSKVMNAQGRYRANMLAGLSNLVTLKLGHKNYLVTANIELPGTWRNVGENGTIDLPQGNKSWSSQDLQDNYDGTKDADTYVRFATLKITYHNQAGKEISPADTIYGRVGTNYSTKAKDIPYYQLDETNIPENSEGTYNGDDINVDYIYLSTAKPVTVKYQDVQGKQIAQDVVLTGEGGTTYTSVAVKIDGYTLKTTPENATGIFTDHEQTVIYIYTKDPVKAGNVIVRYQDEAGHSIHSDIVLTGYINDSYSSTAIPIEGYSLKTAPENSTGQFTNKEQTLIYVYTRNPLSVANVTVHYQDEKGKPVATDVILGGIIGTQYQSYPLVINGYQLKTTPANASGTFTNQKQDVVYVYAKDASANSTAGGQGGGTVIIAAPSTTTGKDNSSDSNDAKIKLPVSKAVMHNSYIYNEKEKRIAGWLGQGTVINTYGTKLINNRKYYVLANNEYVRATNIDGVVRKLRHNAYVFNQAGKKIKLLKRHQACRTYGAAVKRHGKLFYLIGKNRLVKKANF